MELMPTAEPLLVINDIHITYRLTEITHTVTDFEESSLIKNLSLGLTDLFLCQRCPSRNILYKFRFMFFCCWRLELERVGGVTHY